MVKNIPTIERSTKIRFGKNCIEDQGENTIVFNASNVQIDATQPGSVYITPLREVTDVTDRTTKILTYNQTTKEISDSGVAAIDVLQSNFQATTNLGNTTTHTVEFRNPETGFITVSNVGIANALASHTLSIGSNLYVDDTGSNVLVVAGSVSIAGDLTVNGGTTLIKTDNLVIRDPIIEIGQNNITNDTTLDLGLIMGRPGSNVVVGYRELSNEFVMAYTNSSASSNVITPIDSQDLNVHVYGGVLTESNVGVKTTSPNAELHVVGNVYVSSNLTVDTDTFHVDVEADHVGINTKNPNAELHVVGNVYVSSNLTVDTDTFHVDIEADHVGINTKNPNAELHVVGNVYVSSNLTVDTDTFHVDVVNDSVGVGTVNPNANLHVVGNVYVSSNLTVDTDTFHVDAVNDSVGVGTVNPSANLHIVGNVYATANLTVDTDTFHVDVEADHVGINTKNPDAELHVVGNVYVSSNLTVDTDTFHVDVEADRVGINTKNPTSNLHVVGNVYVSSNTIMGGTLTINHPTTAILTDLNSNVEIKLNQLANVVLGEKALANEDMLVYDGSNWRNQLQNHTFLNAKAAEVIDKGDAVYASGAVGNDTFLIRKARANSSTTMPALGVAYQDFANNDIGLIVSFGRADGINTDNFLEGETVYVSNTVAGGLSNVQPYGATDLIQNVGLVVKGHTSTGIISVTGVGRANDIPNAPVVQDESDINYVYVNDENNDFKKIEPSNLLTQLQTFEQVSSAGNVVSNIISFTNARTGLTVSSNLHVGSNISVKGLTDPNNQYLPMVNTDGFLVKSPVYLTPGDKYVIAASEAEFLGNITLSGNTTIINAGSVTISDRIFGLAANNSTSGLDSGIMIEHQEDGAFANVALIFHADEHRFSIGYTQNTFTDNHILHYQDPGGLVVDLRGNVLIQNSATLSSTLDVTGAVTFANDFTVGAVSNLFVDVSTSRVGINEASPTVSLDVGGDTRVQGTTTSSAKTNGALVVAGGVGIAGPLFGAAATLDGVTTITNNTTSSAKGNGALVVAGGVGITGPLFGAAATFDGDVSGLEGIFSGDLTVGGASNLFVDVSLSRVGINTATPQAGLHVVGNAYVSSNLQVSEYTKILDTTNATSKTTGALIVSGGIGVAENIHGKDIFVEDIVSNSVVILDTTESKLRTNGALIVSGGLGVASNVNTTNLHALGTTASASKTTGTVIVAGGVGISGALFGANANLEDVTADSVTASGMVKGATISGTNVYGTLAGANTAAVTTLTASGMVKGATISGTNVYGTLAGANTAAVTTLTASGMVKGATISGTNIYGTIAGANTAAVTTLTASGMVKGATISGTNIYGTIAGANTAAVTTLTASGMVKGATISGTNIYGTIAGANTAAVTTLTASGMVKGATISGTNIYGTIAGANTAAVTTLTASGMVKGATISGTNVYGTLAGANTAAVTTLTASGVVTVSDSTTSTTTTSGALKVAGGVGVVENLNVGGDLKVDTSVLVVNSTTNRVGINKATPGYTLDVDGDINFTGTFREGGVAFAGSPWNVETSPDAVNYIAGNVGIGLADPAANLHVNGDVLITGGLITNTGGVGRKTYSFSTNLTGTTTSVANATYVLDFTNHPFHAKVTAMLIESDDEISTLIFDVIGGKLGGSGNSAYVPALGMTSIISTSTMNTPWDPTIATALAGTTVTIKPANAGAGTVRFNIFVDYLSHEPLGRLTSVNCSGNSPDSGDFGY